ncbi:MAG: peptidase domain-containing ABC transporter [Formosimonas sp.]
MSIIERLNFGWGNKLPMILQTEGAECGLACLVMVAGWHGYVTDLPTLRSRFSLSLKGMTLHDMTLAATQMKLTSRALSLELHELALLKTPCVLHWDLNHFVVLKNVGKTWVEIHDPARGVQKLTLDEVSKHFTGVALELIPALDFIKEKKQQSIRLRDLFGQTVGLRMALFKIFALALVLQLFALGTPFFSQLVFDQVLVTADKDLLTILTWIFLILMLIQVAISTLRSWILMQVSASFNLQWASNVLSHLLRLPMEWFEKRHLGDIVSRFGSVNSIEKMLTSQLVATVLDGIMTIGTFTMLMIYSTQLAMVAVLALVLYALMSALYYRRLELATESELVYAAKADSYFLETLRSMQTIRLFNAAPLRHAAWLNHEVDQRNAGLKMQKINLISSVANGVLFGVEGIVILWLGANMVMSNTLSIGMLVAVLSFKDQFSSRAGNLINQVVALRMMRLQAQRLSDIVLTPVEADNSNVLQDYAHLSGSLELRNISYRYADNLPWVIENYSIQIHAGESVAIVGASGRGKTTLMKIMLGLLEPVSGEVLFGGVPIGQVGLSHYRNQIAAVMQDDQLLSGSIVDNISFFSAPDMERVRQCAQYAAIHADIEAMPMGYHSLIGDMGASLSGGQKQRLLLARALYRQPKILLLDEATSHLDGDNETQVNTALKKLPLTRIVIAHRDTTIAASERVIEL